VIACSALKRAYRDILIASRKSVRLVYLKGGRQLIASRMALRHGHFMPPALLESQFAARREPASEKDAIVVSIDAGPQDIVEQIVGKLGALCPPIGVGKG
jgi:gluconokinase